MLGRNHLHAYKEKAAILPPYQMIIYFLNYLIYLDKLAYAVTFCIQTIYNN